jgi:SAM-dependent methyltransferase
MIPAAGASRPNQARVYDFLLGGKDNFGPDRDLAARLEAAAGGCAPVRELAGINRAFVLKAVQWCASMLAIDQFLDLGCGLPLKPAVHDAARQGCPEATVVYADIDPVVISHVSALQSGDGLAAVLADASDPAAVLEEAVATGLLDLERSACVILGATLSTMPADVARAAVASYAAALAPGSAVVISCGSCADPETGARMAEMAGAAGPWHNHGYEDVASFFAAGGLRVIHGRIMNLACWPTCALTAQDEPASVLGGIGIKD